MASRISTTLGILIFILSATPAVATEGDKTVARDPQTATQGNEHAVKTDAKVGNPETKGGTANYQQPHPPKRDKKAKKIETGTKQVDK